MNTSTDFTKTAIILHWLMALLLIGLFAVGLYMSDLPLSPWKLKIYSWHKWVGISAFFLALIRLVWRFTHPAPKLPDITPLAFRFAARISHGVLYLLMIAIPVSGWLMSSAKGFQTIYFGIIPIPDMLEKNKELGDILQETHEILNYLFIGLVTVHVGASIKHHLIDKDDVLTRMLFRQKR